MDIFKGNIKLFLFILMIIIGATVASPMFYKKKENDIYEPDLIAVSSTVIPLLEYQNGNSNETHHNHHPSPFSEEYKLAYMKHFHKKAVDLEPDTLITMNGRKVTRNKHTQSA